MVSSANLVWPMDFPARCPRLARCTMQMGFDSFRRRFDASTCLSFQSSSRFSSLFGHARISWDFEQCNAVHGCVRFLTQPWVSAIFVRDILSEITPQ